MWSKIKKSFNFETPFKKFCVISLICVCIVDGDGLCGEPTAAGRAFVREVQGGEGVGAQVSGRESQDGGRHLQQHPRHELQPGAGRHVRLPSGIHKMIKYFDLECQACLKGFTVQLLAFEVAALKTSLKPGLVHKSFFQISFRLSQVKCCVDR